jgi:hypothetical protein
VRVYFWEHFSGEGPMSYIPENIFFFSKDAKVQESCVTHIHDRIWTSQSCMYKHYFLFSDSVFRILMFNIYLLLWDLFRARHCITSNSSAIMHGLTKYYATGKINSLLNLISKSPCLANLKRTRAFV